MESQPQNPEFRINPENFHPCLYCVPAACLAPFCPAPTPDPYSLPLISTVQLRYGIPANSVMLMKKITNLHIKQNLCKTTTLKETENKFSRQIIA